MTLREMIDEYDGGADWFVLKDSGYTRQKLSKLKDATGADYTTMRVEGDLFVLFNERHAEKLMAED